jgi:hypothetical protein
MFFALDDAGYLRVPPFADLCSLEYDTQKQDGESKKRGDRWVGKVGPLEQREFCSLLPPEA